MGLPAATRLSFADDGNLVAIGFTDGSLLAGFLDTAEPFTGHAGLAAPVCSVDLESGQGQLLAAADNRVCVWDIASAGLITPLDHDHQVVQCGIVSSGCWLTVDDYRCARFHEWDSAGALTCRTVIVEGSDRVVDEFAVNLARNRIVFRRSLGWCVYDLAVRSVTAVHSPIDGSRLAYMDGEVAFSRNGEFFLVYWDDGSVFCTDTGEVAHQFPRSMNPARVRISNTGDRCLFGTLDGRLVLRDVHNFDLLTRDIGSDPPMHIDISPDGSRIAFVTSDGEFAVLDAASGEQLLNRERLEQRGFRHSSGT